MTRAVYIDYSCGNPDCPDPHVGREMLTVKKVVFLEMGLGGRTIRSRVSAWLCPHCLVRDPDYNREKFITPAITDSHLVNG